MPAVRSCAALAMLVELAGCSDLFHSTDWKTRCPDGVCPSDQGSASSGAGGAAGGATVSSGGAIGSAGAGGECAGAEDCATAADDDCDGLANESCPAVGYRFDVKTHDTLQDEPHNLATTGNAADGTKFGESALGQLVDGMKGVDDTNQDLGNGAAYEWVVWVAPTVGITFDFGVPRDVTQVEVGISNVGLYVYEPSEIHVGFSDDGSIFARVGPGFKLSDGTLPAIAEGLRGDVTLAVRGRARYVKVTLVQSTTGGAEALDEVTFD